MTSLTISLFEKAKCESKLPRAISSQTMQKMCCTLHEGNCGSCENKCMKLSERETDLANSQQHSKNILFNVNNLERTQGLPNRKRGQGVKNNLQEETEARR